MKPYEVLDDSEAALAGPISSLEEFRRSAGFTARALVKAMLRSGTAPLHPGLILVSDASAAVVFVRPARGRNYQLAVGYAVEDQVSARSACWWAHFQYYRLPNCPHGDGLLVQYGDSAYETSHSESFWVSASGESVPTGRSVGDFNELVRQYKSAE